MTKRWRCATNERGQATFTLIIVLVVVAIAALLLQRTAHLAESINGKAETIAETGGGINQATDAVLKLGRTNELAGSILQTAQPLQGQLAEIIRLAQSIDGLASSINGTAGAINGTARGINDTASTILGTARRINDGVAQINTNLDTTLALANQIKSDTGNILVQAVTARGTAACISQGPLLGNVQSGECR